MMPGWAKRHETRSFRRFAAAEFGTSVQHVAHSNPVVVQKTAKVAPRPGSSLKFQYGIQSSRSREVTCILNRRCKFIFHRSKGQKLSSSAFQICKWLLLHSSATCITQSRPRRTSPRLPPVSWQQVDSIGDQGWGHKGEVQRGGKQDETPNADVGTAAFICTSWPLVSHRIKVKGSLQEPDQRIEVNK